MTSRVGLLALYSLMTLMHFFGLLVNGFVMTSRDSNITITSQLLFAFVPMASLVMSDILLIAEELISFENDLAITAEYMDAYVIFSFLCLFLNLNNAKIASLFKSTEKHLHALLHYFIILKSISGIAIFFVGISLCGLSPNKDYLPFFTSIFYCFGAFGNFAFMLTAKLLISFLKIGAKGKTDIGFEVNARSIFYHAYATPRKYKLSIKSTRIAPAPTDEKIHLTDIERALLEVNAAFRGGILLDMLGSAAVIITLFLLNDFTVQSGIVISIPWKLAIGIGNLITPLAHLRAKLLK